MAGAKLGGGEEHTEYMCYRCFQTPLQMGAFAFSWNTPFIFQPCENTVTLRAFKALRGAICRSTDSVPPVACTLPFLGRYETEVGNIHYMHAFTASSRPAWKKWHFLSNENAQLIFSPRQSTHNSLESSPECILLNHPCNTSTIMYSVCMCMYIVFFFSSKGAGTMWENRKLASWVVSFFCLHCTLTHTRK